MENGSFKECHRDNVKGTLSLYESYYFSSEGDSRMEAAWRFASKTLREHLDDIADPNLGIKVRHALKSPTDWRMPKLEARWYMDVYAKSDNMNPAILELAKLDFNIVQGVYQEDLKIFTRYLFLVLMEMENYIYVVITNLTRLKNIVHTPALS